MSLSHIITYYHVISSVIVFTYMFVAYMSYTPIFKKKKKGDCKTYFSMTRFIYHRSVEFSFKSNYTAGKEQQALCKTLFVSRLVLHPRRSPDRSLSIALIIPGFLL